MISKLSSALKITWSSKNTLSGNLLSSDQSDGYHVRLFEEKSEKHFHSEVLVLLSKSQKTTWKTFLLETGQSQIFNSAFLFFQIQAHAENNTYARRLGAALGLELYLTSNRKDSTVIN